MHLQPREMILQDACLIKDWVYGDKCRKWTQLSVNSVERRCGMRVATLSGKGDPMEINKDQQYKDPVCGMDVTPDDAEAAISFEGRKLYFCSDECREEFEKDPEQYKNKAA